MIPFNALESQKSETAHTEFVLIYLVYPIHVSLTTHKVYSFHQGSLEQVLKTYD